MPHIDFKLFPNESFLVFNNPLATDFLFITCLCVFCRRCQQIFLIFPPSTPQHQDAPQGRVVLECAALFCIRSIRFTCSRENKILMPVFVMSFDGWESSANSSTCLISNLCESQFASCLHVKAAQTLLKALESRNKRNQMKSWLEDAR